MVDLKETIYGNVARGWDFIPANLYCEKVTDGTHDSPRPQNTGKPLITSKHIKGKEITFDSAYLIDESEFNKINLRSRVNQWDVIISMIGEYCGFCYVESNKIVDYAVKNVGLFKTGSRLKAMWLYYFLNSRIGKSILEAHKSGTSQPYLSLGSLRELPVLYPTADKEAEQIVEVLSSLDDKIHLLQRQNKTLEALAETLFRYWFVEKAEDSWERKPLDQIANYLNGIALQKYPANGAESLPVIKIKELNQGITEATDRCRPTIPNQYIIHDGDIIFSWSGSLQLVIWYDGEGALNQHLFKVTSEEYPKWFFYLATKQHLEHFRAIADSKSTTMGHIQRHHLSEATIPIAPEPFFLQYHEAISPLFEKVILNNSQIKTLTKHRDSLLPKLMSGEISVEN